MEKKNVKTLEKFSGIEDKKKILIEAQELSNYLFQLPEGVSDEEQKAFTRAVNEAVINNKPMVLHPSVKIFEKTKEAKKEEAEEETAEKEEKEE